jgi:hypothetical protein
MPDGELSCPVLLELGLDCLRLVLWQINEWIHALRVAKAIGHEAHPGLIVIALASLAARFKVRWSCLNRC